MMKKETIQEINRLSNKVRELQAKLDQAVHSLNFYKEQNAKHQQIIGQLEAKEQVPYFKPDLNAAPVQELPEITKEDY